MKFLFYSRPPHLPKSSMVRLHSLERVVLYNLVAYLSSCPKSIELPARKNHVFFFCCVNLVPQASKNAAFVGKRRVILSQEVVNHLQKDTKYSSVYWATTRTCSHAFAVHCLHRSLPPHCCSQRSGHAQNLLYFIDGSPGTAIEQSKITWSQFRRLSGLKDRAASTVAHQSEVCSHVHNLMALVF